MNKTDVIGIRALQMVMHVCILVSEEEFSFDAEVTTVEFATFVPLIMFLPVLVLLISNSLAAKTINTIIGIKSPCSNQISISFRLESSGIFSKIALYRVYMTRFDVRATIIIASKCDSSIKREISAANMRQTDGIKSDIQKGPESLWISKAK